MFLHRKAAKFTACSAMGRVVTACLQRFRQFNCRRCGPERHQAPAPGAHQVAREGSRFHSSEDRDREKSKLRQSASSCIVVTTFKPLECDGSSAHQGLICIWTNSISLKSSSAQWKLLRAKEVPLASQPTKNRRQKKQHQGEKVLQEHRGRAAHPQPCLTASKTASGSI